MFAAENESTKDVNVLVMLMKADPQDLDRHRKGAQHV